MRLRRVVAAAASAVFVGLLREFVVVSPSVTASFVARFVAAVTGIVLETLASLPTVAEVDSVAPIVAFAGVVAPLEELVVDGCAGAIHGAGVPATVH